MKKCLAILLCMAMLIGLPFSVQAISISKDDGLTLINAYAMTNRFVLDWTHGTGGSNNMTDYGVLLYRYAKGKPWTRVVWDVTAVGWLTNNGKFFKHRLEDNIIPQDDATYLRDSSRSICYVYEINRDYLFEDLFNTLAQNGGLS